MRLSVIRRYPAVAATIVVGLAVFALLGTGLPTAAARLASGYALLVAAVTGARMVRDLLRGHWGLDVLAVLAILATVAVGEYAAALIIVLMLSGGEALEDFAARRARSELDALLERAPQAAHRLPPDSETPRDIPAASVVVGDVLLVKPAELVPVDGILLSAEAAFDESSLTGESLPVTRAAGETVMSGSVNGPQAVRIRATATTADSQYQRIVALVREAAASKAPVVRLADRFAVPFTAVSLLIAGGAWLLSGDPVRFAEVLVLATPCPLLIAAPVAFLGGMSRSARNGIIVKGGATLQQLARARSIAFDKTGTLSYGRPHLVAVSPEPPFTAGEVLRLAASAEQYSSHVLAAAVQAAALEKGLVLSPATSAAEVATNGVQAQVAGRTVLVGKRRFVAAAVRNGLPGGLPGGVAGGISGTGAGPAAGQGSLAAAGHGAAGELLVYVGVDGRFAGTLTLRDTPRDNARATLERLARLGLGQPVMLTGDGRASAESTAAALGIRTVHAELLPEDKVRLVAALPLRPAIMVGDGVNDAPVLAAADVGIAMGARGSTAAGESADAVIVADDISKVADAVDIGRRTLRVALESIWLGILLSVGLMLTAAFGFIPAVAGALTQELVDLAAILNALRTLGSGTGYVPASSVPDPAEEVRGVPPGSAQH
ncbi:heavy metal translocating P-type ATPase [Arthrobacter sp. zg-Y820]|uniref:heavy metal translocating P-type ATPase n=1 Tax=unclassified Arthrobacter TaxID=235627 RepID=UPI001E5E5187|nr:MULTISPECIES: heavy metal translocating P-type ATPase [unclassified Arthrobacter]MCC9197175.1 heavy metal translocating P-type ATPase [Arthrobacter sp. zg-Y820]MDK1280040.1 heavy metal translocating P-type ATPase [Arthrobacter sp. zg.Y820]WIB09335.1 heavy metal translocating P-type ATPase [Arthrobacter sp. zg-Y820]